MWSEALHSFSQVEGVGLHWAELGRANGTVPLVLLHGLNDSYLTWKHVAPALAHNRRVLTLDLPGHGLSERPDASYELGWHAHIIAKWFDQIGVELADIVGHSYGGGVAQMLLLECPARVRRLVLIASGGLGGEIGIALRLATIPLAVEFLGQPFMAVGTRLALWGSSYSEEDIAETCAMTAKPGSARAFARTVRVAVGRKNWLFAGSDAGGRRAAILYSLIGTCHLVGVEPFAYLRDVLVRIPSHPNRRLIELTPRGWQAAQPAS